MAAAPPFLASTLLSTAQAHAKKCPPPLSSGSAAIDTAAMAGGFRHGEITSIAGISGTGKTLLSYHLIASHLLTSPLGEIALIDTTGSFSPVFLRNVLVFRLRAQVQQASYQHSGYVHETSGPDEDDASIEGATTMLDRVKVMRVFDLAGVVEAVSEVGEMIEKAVQQISEPPAAAAAAAEEHQRRTKDEIGDSEDEDSLESEDLAAEQESGIVQKDKIGQVGVLIIDSITPIISAVMSRSQTQGHTLMTNFMQSLHLLTNRHHLCTLLINAAVGTTLSTNPHPRQAPIDPVSIFVSTLGRPALGRTFTFLIDTSIFLSLVPKTTNDADIEFGEGRNLVETSRKAVVFEILKDRRGAREGRWTAFEIPDGIKLVPCFS